MYIMTFTYFDEEPQVVVDSVDNQVNEFLRNLPEGQVAEILPPQMNSWTDTEGLNWTRYAVSLVVRHS